MNFFNGKSPFGGQFQMTPRPGGNPAPYGINRGAAMPPPQYGVNQGPLMQLRGQQPTGSLPEALQRIQGGLAGQPMQPAAPPQVQQAQPMNQRMAIAQLLMKRG